MDVPDLLKAHEGSLQFSNSSPNVLPASRQFAATIRHLVRHGPQYSFHASKEFITNVVLKTQILLTVFKALSQLSLLLSESMAGARTTLSFRIYLFPTYFVLEYP